MDIKIPSFTIHRPSKIDPNWDFWFENKPSGNPDQFQAWKNFNGKFSSRLSIEIIKD
jgi:hypothetical protein